VSEEQRNYGVEPDPSGSDSGGAGPGGGLRTTTMSPKDEDTWSVLAHLSVFLNLVTGFLGPVAALVIWLMYKDRSSRVSFHALQSLWYQVAWIVIIFAYVILSTILTFVIIGIFMFFLMPLIALVPIVHQCYAAYKVNQGVDYRYPVIADMIDGSRRFA
jgi:uncharacterized protein